AATPHLQVPVLLFVVLVLFALPLQSTFHMFINVLSTGTLTLGGSNLDVLAAITTLQSQVATLQGTHTPSVSPNYNLVSHSFLCAERAIAATVATLSVTPVGAIY